MLGLFLAQIGFLGGLIECLAWGHGWLFLLMIPGCFLGCTMEEAYQERERKN